MYIAIVDLTDDGIITVKDKVNNFQVYDFSLLYPDSEKVQTEFEFPT
jgi:hypothetical protein